MIVSMTDSPILDETVMVFLNTPTLFVSYLTSISEDSPGAMACVGYTGTVHPQLPLALVIRRGSSPVFLNENFLSGSASFFIIP